MRGTKEIIKKLEDDLTLNEKMLPKNPVSDKPPFFLLSRIGYIQELLKWIKGG